jgi:hypothetical protein
MACARTGDHVCWKFKRNHRIIEVNGHPMPVHRCRSDNFQWVDLGKSIVVVGDHPGPVNIIDPRGKSEHSDLR